MRRFGAGSLVLLGMMVPACGAAPEDLDDVATTISNLLADQAGEMEILGDAQLVMAGAMPAGMQAEDGVIAGRRGRVDYELRFECKRADGQAQAICSPMTDTAKVDATWRGDVQTLRHSARIERKAVWSFKNLTTDVAHFDGTGTTEMEARFTALFRPVTRRIEVTATAVYQDVHVDLAKRIPISGKVMYDVAAKWLAVSGADEIERDLDVSVDLTIGAGGEAVMVVDEDRRYRLDLPTGRLALEE